MRWMWLLYLVLIFGLSSIPGSSAGAGLPLHLDKVVHFILYAGFGAVFVGVSGIGATGAGRALLIAVILAAAVGVCDEFYQELIPGRTRELGDWIADASGGACGALALLGIGRRRSGKRGETP